MTNYWLIESEEAKAKWDEMVAVAEQKRLDLKVWVDELGGSGSCLVDSDGNVSGVHFDKPPGKEWAKSKNSCGYYYPKRNSKAGKLLYGAMKEHRNGLDRGDVAKTFLGKWRIFTDGRICGCGWEHTSEGQILLATQGDGIEQWAPIAGLRLLKDSEYWTIKEAQPRDEGE